MAYTVTTNTSSLINSTDFTGNGSVSGTGGAIDERGFLFLEDTLATPVKPDLVALEGDALTWPPYHLWSLRPQISTDFKYIVNNLRGEAATIVGWGATSSFRFRTRSYGVGDIAIDGSGNITGSFLSIKDLVLLSGNGIYILDPAVTTGTYKTGFKCTNYTNIGDLLDVVVGETTDNTSYLQTNDRWQTWKVNITPGLIRVYLRNDDTETTFTLVGSAAYTCSFNPAGESMVWYYAGAGSMKVDFIRAGNVIGDLGGVRSTTTGAPFGVGAYTYLVNKLNSETNYRTRAFIMTGGSPVYGNVINTLTDPPLMPTIVHTYSRRIRQYYFMGHLSITVAGDNPVTCSGFCYRQASSGTPNVDDDAVATDTTGHIAPFDVNIFIPINPRQSGGAEGPGTSGLLRDSDYRVRAFAYTLNGIVYGATITVHTAKDSPRVLMGRIAEEDIGEESITLRAEVSTTGGVGDVITERGFVYIEGIEGDTLFPDVLDEDCSDLSDWTDQSTTAVSPPASVTAIGDSFVFYTGDGGTAQIYQALGFIPRTFTIEVETEFGDADTMVAGEYFTVLLETDQEFAFCFRVGTDIGYQFKNGPYWVTAYPNKFPLNERQKWIINIQYDMNMLLMYQGMNDDRPVTAREFYGLYGSNTCSYGTPTGITISFTGTGKTMRVLGVKIGAGFGYWSGNPTHTISETGSFSVGEYSLEVTGLRKNEVHLVRAFAKNSYAVGVSDKVRYALTKTPSTGLIVYTDYDGLSPSPIPYESGFKHWIFNRSGTMYLKASAVAEVLLIAGGGAGLSNTFSRSAGGGAGGVIHSKEIILSQGLHTITVGNGGNPIGAIDGENSEAFGLVAYGGGGTVYQFGNDGGSGGGGNFTSGGGAGVSGQGNDGADNGGGGGGAGAPGVVGNGGNGILLNVVGESFWYGGGGCSSVGVVGKGNGGHGDSTMSRWVFLNPAYWGTYNDSLPGTGGGGCGSFPRVDYAPDEDNIYAGVGGSGLAVIKISFIPLILTAFPKKEGNELTWTGTTPYHESYNIYWANAPGVTVETGNKIEGVLEPYYLHEDVTVGEWYYYIVCSVENGIESDPSNEAFCVAYEGYYPPDFYPANYHTCEWYIKLLTSEYQLAEKFKAWLRSVVCVYLQDTMTCANQLNYDFDIELAIGVQLDAIGEIVGQSRTLGFTPSDPAYLPVLYDDEIYRRVLKSRIALNHWDGQLGSIQEKWLRIFPGTNIVITDNQDMTITVSVTGYMDELIKDMIEHDMIIPRPQGVMINYVWSPRDVKIFALDYEIIEPDYGGFDVAYWEI